ncbi:MAG: hypothetical protein IJW74_03835, partial [Oscillospiraceae bacterium]|nr:hypothetical protein [Oscillospiraceae bacterium]
MTMHTSKGLEFPICFISGLGTAFNKMDRANRLMIDPVLGMATYAIASFGYNVSTPCIQAIKQKVLAANADDEMRLLYVALTRARQKMIVTASLGDASRLVRERTKGCGNVSPYSIIKAMSHIDWIVGAWATDMSKAE